MSTDPRGDIRSHPRSCLHYHLNVDARNHNRKVSSSSEIHVCTQARVTPASNQLLQH